MCVWCINVYAVVALYETPGFGGICVECDELESREEVVSIFSVVRVRSRRTSFFQCLNCINDIL